MEGWGVVLDLLGWVPCVCNLIAGFVDRGISGVERAPMTRCRDGTKRGVLLTWCWLEELHDEGV